ncbi:uncharacterized protein LOC133888464 [Phragmites australis]|uniref:uncharacterized protein LOC133888464 n=1 Tax=Phragmites australis TaxID=29695 RepID=UPI002D7815B6|nr:uncharacterized protein LOC133888464 [Phragmites australis]
MAHHPPPRAAGEAPRTPLEQRSAPCVTYVQKCVVLVDWWLERVEGEDGKIRVAGFTDTAQTRQGASSSKGNKRRAVRVFKSAAISRRYDYFTIETADGNLIKIGRLLNIPQTRDNGFPQEVCECFELGFPVEWEKLANPNMEQMNGQAGSPSKSTANAPSSSVECCMEKLLCGSIINSIGYTFAESDFNSSRMSTSNTDGHLIQRLSNLSNGNTGNRDSLMGKMAASKGLGDGRMDICTSVTSSDLKERGTPKRGKASVDLGTANALEVSSQGMTPQFGAVRGSEDNTVRRLRSGKVFGVPSSAPANRGYMEKRMKHEASNGKMVSNEGVTTTADLTSHGNGCSVAGIVAEEIT